MGSLLSSEKSDNRNNDVSPTPDLSPSSGATTTDPNSMVGNYKSDDIANSSLSSSSYDPQSATESTSSYVTTMNSTTMNFSNGSTNSSTFDDPNQSSEDFKLNLFGTYIYPFRWLTLATFYSWLGPLSSLAMIIGCVLPYVPQYLTIHKNQNSRGFSKFVCLTLLLANILRVAFWFGHPFELPLLIQSIIMILAQLMLLELCVRVKRLGPPGSIIRRRFISFNLRYFWRWTDLCSYIEFLCLVSALLGAAMYFLIDCELFVETIGYCALVTESMLGLPQVIKNQKNRSVEGMSLSMVLMWLGGDTFKTGYFILNNVPLQFWLCGLLQITIDLLILVQVCLFRQKAPVKHNPRADSYTPKELAL